MSNNQLAGFPAFGPRVDSTITYNPKSIFYDPVVDIPASPNYAYAELTIESGDLPTFSPYIPPSISTTFPNLYNCYLIAVIQNISGTSSTLYASYSATGTTYVTADSGSVPAYKFATYYAPGLTTPALGSTQRMRFRASNADMLKLVAAHMIIYPNYLASGLSGASNLQIDLSGTCLLGGTAQTRTPFVFTTGPCQESITDSVNIAAASTGTTEGFGFVNIPSHNVGSSHDTIAAYYNIPYYPTRIAYTPIL